MACTCPEGFTVSGTECIRDPNPCPPGFSGTDCSVAPSSYTTDTSSNGFDQSLYDVNCVWAGGTDTSCFTCPANYPKYNGPYYDSSWIGNFKMRCDISTADLANQHDVSPWGHDSDTPILDAAGNITWPSIVTQALRSIAIPLPDPTIPCAAGEYMPVSGPPVSDGGSAIQLVNGLLPGTCIKCNLGNYCGRGYRAQIPCPAGFVCPTPDVMTPCTAGQMCPEGSTAFSTCPPGRYCPASQTLTSFVCPAGSFCPAGSTAPQACNTGEYCAEGSDHPSDCPAGSYCSNPTSAPVLCPAGSYCPSRSWAPISCPAGSYCPAGAKVATTCATGTYCPPGAQAPQDCAAGFYCDTPSTQTACAAGTYSAASRVSSASSCTQCPAGSTCPYTGPGTLYSLPRTSPITCAPGYYCPAGSTTFALCPEGWYCPMPTQKIQCPNGSVCPTGSISTSSQPTIEVSSPGVENCRTICARGTGIPAGWAWNGAICVAVPSTTYSCEDVPRTNVTCRCQRAYNFGWIV